MWKLTIEDDEGQQTSLSLAVDEYRLGRADANTIRLTDRNVSRNHAILKKNGQAWIVKDLQSYNGTYVNGVRVIGETPVQNGDIVQLGDYRLELIDEALQVPLDPNASTPTQSAVPPVHLRPNRLVVVVGPTPGQEFPLDRDHVTIGRSEDATISINHSSVSRLHAELISLGNGRYEIIDKGSANGIRVNGVDLRRGILEAGDALELGDVRLRFVGAGKIFRAGVDPSQRLPRELTGSTTSIRPSSGVSIGKLVGAGAVVGVLLIVAFILIFTFGTGKIEGSTTDIPHAPATSEDNQKLEEAKKLLDSGDIEGAHKKVLEIPENSSAREDDTFKSVERKWADSIFEKANQATEPLEKRRLLNQIMATPSVDAEQRRKAATLANEITIPEPTAKPVGPGPGTMGGGQNPYEPAQPQPTPTKTADTPPPPVGGPPDEAAMRRALEPKVWGGRASLEEIRLLKAICSHMGDRTCRDRANAMLKQKQQQ
jgi:pSer/pThr/pTyr-binding forkhead associated (FHA) protein